MKYIKFKLILVLGLLLFVSMINAQNTADLSKSPLTARIYLGPQMTNLTSNLFQNEEKSGWGYLLGSSVAYEVYKMRKWNFNLSLGLSLIQYNSSRKGDFVNELITIDADNDEVHLIETLEGLSENQQMLFLNIPLKIQGIYQISPKYDVYANLGFSYGINLHATYQSSAVVTRTGYYPAYNVLLYDINMHGSPYYFPNKYSMTTDGKINGKYNTMAEIGVGLKYKLSEKLKIFGEINYAHGLRNIKSSANEEIFAPDDKVLNSLSIRNDKYTTQNVGVEIGAELCINNLNKLWNMFAKHGSIDKMENAQPPIAEKQLEKQLTTQKTVMDTTSIRKPDQINNSLITNHDFGKDSIVTNNMPKDTLKTNINIDSPSIIKKEDRPVSSVLKIDSIESNKPSGKSDNKPSENSDIKPDNLLLKDTLSIRIKVKDNDKVDSLPISSEKREKIVEKKLVYFPAGKSDLSPQSVKQIDSLINSIQNYQSFDLEILGHAEDGGTAYDDMILSRERALAVRRYLQKKGISVENTRTISDGGTQPADKNRTDEDKKKNRRAELKVTTFK